MMAIDVKSAYLNAKATRDVHISIPKEDQAPNDEGPFGPVPEPGDEEDDEDDGKSITLSVAPCFPSSSSLSPQFCFYMYIV